MTYNYDKLYGSQPQALGEPTKVFVEFFQLRKERHLRVLDVGCGQGRDALFIARMGHSVVGVDLSANGIHAMMEAAKKEDLSVDGFVADIRTFVVDGEFDVIVFDRTLHMLPQNEQLDVLGRLIGSIHQKGWILIADERANIIGFKDLFAAQSEDWQVAFNKGGTLFMQHA